MRSDSFSKLIEQLEANSPNPGFSLYLFVGVLIVPVFPAIILTLLQIYPATIGIEWLADEHGVYSVKAAVFVNVALFILGAFVISLPLLIANRIYYERHKRKAAKQ